MDERRFTLVLPLLLTQLMFGCAPLRSTLLAPLQSPEARLARSVEISRDEWGVPHIHARTGAGVAFGLAYAQAEDNYWQIEEAYIHALGLASYWYGERYLAADMVKAAFEVQRLSREEYDREPADRQAVWNAFAAGLNYYVRTTRAQSRVIGRWEPWMLFARLRTVEAGTSIDGVRLGDVAITAADLPASGIRLVGVPDDAAVADRPGAAYGSIAWAVAGSRTAAGHALLSHSHYSGFFGNDLPYEVHVHSGDGWQVRGFTVLGTPIPRAGHNEHLAWSHTNTDADHADVYEVVFDHPADPLMYRVDDEWRRAIEWEDTVRINTASGVQSHAVRFRRTHHGPIVAEREGRSLAVRVGRMEEGGSLQQWYAMNRARNLAEFRAALDQRALPTSNTMYADTAGNIYYLHGNAVPQRDATFDWTRPVDGNTAATEWLGYHPIDQLPHLLNPASGWLQNTNATPFRVTADGHNPDPGAYPSYMARAHDNAPARASRRLLDPETSWTLDAWERAVFDTYVIEAETEIPRLVLEWEQVGGSNPERAMRLDEGLDLLRAWDRTATLDSEATTLFVLWQELLRSGDNAGGPAGGHAEGRAEVRAGDRAEVRAGDRAGDFASEYGGEYGRFRAFEDVLTRLEREWGSVRVAWGEVNRLQRVHTNGADLFRDDRHSLPVSGVPGWTGAVFNVRAQWAPNGRRRYGTSGHGWVGIVQLGPRVESRTVVPFGQSANPASPHFFDQAERYAAGLLKPAWFERDDVVANARRVYQPGR